MAQPVFDGHPLEQYFHDTGEPSEFMPGGIVIPHMTSLHLSRHSERFEKICYLVFSMLESLSSLFSSDRSSRRTKAFAERFKYGLISSSLLSPPLAATHMVEPQRRGLSTSLPGKLSNSHSRTPSAAESTSTTDNISLAMPPDPETPIWPLTLSFTVAVATLSARFYSLAFLLLVATLYYMHVHRLDIRSKLDVMTPSLIALQHLIAAGQLWDTVINDTFTILENEEQSIFYGPASPLMPSSSLRVALSSTLLTTQTQCDNVRRLLAAITCPSELAQLAEMYAPPSPIKPNFPPSNDSWRRPLSHPGLSTRATTPATDRARKRSTWNGSYASLAGTPSPSSSSFQLAQRREKRRSDLNALQQLGNTASPTPARRRPQSVLSSPSQLLADVSEGEEDGMVTAESSLADEEEHSFGTAALGLYRTRVQGGLRALELSSHSHRTPISTMTPTTKRRPTTMSPGSKYTRMQAKTRHPFALSSLRQSLQTALASKRFACSHLLALRFDEVGGAGGVHWGWHWHGGEGWAGGGHGDRDGHRDQADQDDGDGAEAYWEDVRAVMGLLTSTFVDAAQRLAEALEEVEEMEVQFLGADEDGVRTPSSAPASPPPPPPPVRAQLSLSRAQVADETTTLSRAQVADETTTLSYAPTPSHLARFAAHVDAISTALDDAREQLTRCVASLKDEQEVAPSLTHSPSPGHSSHPSTSSSGSASATGTGTGTGAEIGANVGTYGEPADHPAIQAYERLRRELGLALRECERGRERLVSLVVPPTPSTEEEMLGDVQGDEEVVEKKGGEKGTDKADGDVSPTVVSPSGEAVVLEPESLGLGLSGMNEHEHEHDAVTHPFDVVPPGIEQVFEAESGNVGAFNRERSMLSREERIRFVKAQREARERRRRDPFLDPEPAGSTTTRTPSPPGWGPSGEVVQELRDVIWKVGERRRKMTAMMTLEESQSHPVPALTDNNNEDDGEVPA